MNPPLSGGELAHALTMAGLEVEAMDAVAPSFTHVVVGEVLAVSPHPNADRLNICRVDGGQSEALQIVCGAPNVRPGIKVPCALVGATLPGMTIKPAKLRGVESYGMLCSAKELGAAEDGAGLLLLAEDAPVGMDIRAYLALDDQSFTLKLTPNRSDCLSVAGVAREVAAITECAIVLPEISPFDAEIGDQLSVAIKAPSACSRYCGRVIRGVNAAATTPRWMAQRLERSGLRRVHPLVDITNYVMLELGQPLHAFDLGQLDGDVTVRLARPGESLVLLNERTVALEDDMLVIADNHGAQALAGIMGGLHSAVTGTTRDIFLESAFFNPSAIIGKSRRLGMSSDSAYRFERGVDFALARNALERATQLVSEICGGRVGPVTEVIGELPQRNPIILRRERASKVIGVEFSAEQVSALLTRLRFPMEEQNGVYHVIPPSYRFDLAIEEDLIEELVRLYGYDNVPALLPQGREQLLPRTESARPVHEIRSFMVMQDYQEIVNYSFVEAEWEADFAANLQPIRLQNPIAAHLAVMRSTLLGGLVETLRFNLNRSQERARLFEIGRCFLPGKDISQPLRIAGLSYGSAKPEQWGEAKRDVDFYDVKGDVEALFWPDSPRFEAASHPAFHPGQCASVMLDDAIVGWLGVLHPHWRQKYHLMTGPVVGFELELAPLLQRTPPHGHEISKFPPVRRDLAVVVDEKINLQNMLDVMLDNLPDVVSDLTLFDVYRGKGIDSDKKSLAFRVMMQDTRKTLNDEEIDAVMARLVDVLSDRIGAELRN